MEGVSDEPISQLIRSARRRRQLSQYTLARELSTVSGKPTVTRDLVARWERGHQIPRYGSRQWLSVVLGLSQERLDAAAAASRRRTRLGHAVVTNNAPVKPGPARRAQGTPALLPVFRSRVQAGILAAALLNPHRSFSLSELAEHAGGSLASVDKESRLLEVAGILTSRTEGTIRLMRAADTGPMVRPLTELIKTSYGVPQIIGEEFGRLAGVARILLGGVWAERFAGIPGPAPDSIEVLIITARAEDVDQGTVGAAARRAQGRLRCPVHVSVRPLDPRLDYLQIPHQRANQPVVEVAPVRPKHPGATGAPWPDGRQAVTKLVSAGQLEMVGGPATDHRPFLRLAELHIGAAEQLIDTSPPSAFLLLSESAQLIASALLVHQGLRPATGAAEHVPGDVVTAQFGHQFSQVELLRQRSKELRNPISRDSHVTNEEVKTYLATTRSLLSVSHNVIGSVGTFSVQ
ncbi:hypothetical protein BAY61_22985 [Prauserella marina]|uniref:Uncharacterized protein n=1 Tax=Prauserella marina TaxID=530584 RepID=A0A222W0A0_9PSEU|nr:hypothetical protein [Prauserella marina]ASR39570.1 hypothetical protein BAY61_22985 [Prauserella marina]PWV74735.1 hypothetical protein DES30_107133 [Prauserella marina]SDD42073.1 hypothetical protein SAMN05421630_108118 [Prauserella marina]